MPLPKIVVVKNLSDAFWRVELNGMVLSEDFANYDMALMWANALSEVIVNPPPHRKAK